MNPIEPEDFSNIDFSDLANAEHYPFEEITATGKEVIYPSVQKKLDEANAFIASGKFTLPPR